MTMVFEKLIGPKREWRRYRARVAQLPPNYRAAVEAIQRYLMYFGGGGDGAGWAVMLDDLATLFEQSAAAQTPIREIVGDDPVEFVDAFARNYPVGQWITRERARFINAINRAAADEETQS
jgi:DNA-binding ferritin-like protein (Dps family)